MRAREAPGTVIVDPAKRYLYYVLGGGRAVRYGVGVGREGLRLERRRLYPLEAGMAEMVSAGRRCVERQPRARQIRAAERHAGGPGNPLGARAMYLWQGNKDTYYRIHGTNEPWTIGSRVSSGCIRMINQDAIDLYDRTALNAKVIVLPA